MALEWEPVDDDTASLLTLVADEHHVSADHEWSLFVEALRTVAIGPGGRIGPNELRPLLRGKVAPRRIGAFTHRALSQGLVEYTGAYEISDDTHGRNGGKPARVMRWVGVA
jgi:hypothetical protein